MPTSTQADFESRLPEFEVTRFHIQEPSGSYDMLQVRCPRTHCHGEFWVKGSWVAIKPVAGREGEPASFPIGRNCPYCCRASAVPKVIRIIWRDPKFTNGPRHPDPRGERVITRTKSGAPVIRRIKP